MSGVTRNPYERYRDMGEYASAYISIGGTLKESDVAALVAAIRRDGGTLDDYAVIEVTEDDLGAEVLDVDVAGTPLQVHAEEASYGHFDATETACRALGLAYVTNSEASDHANAGLLWWAPGMETPRECDADDGGGPLVPVAEVRAAWGRGPVDLEELLASYDPPAVPPLTLAEGE